MSDAMRSRISLPDFLPLLTGIFAGPANTIVIGQTGEGNASWDVFSEEGKYLGGAIVPSGFVPMAARGGLLAGIQTTASFEAAVRVVRLRESVAEIG
jgi:hypothetical protein